MLIVGVIADDFTGASDAASFLVKGNLNTILTNGVPKDKIENYQAIVIALKSRTQEVSFAVNDSLAAFHYLKDLGAKVIYNKFGSTFDSTPKGNIGPISDALLEASKEKWSIIAPSVPINGRTVKEGHLYIYGKPLHKTHMAFHPITPMWDSSIKELMKEQSKYPVYLENEDKPNIPYYIVPDYETDADGQQIIDKYNQCRFFVGGSGLLEHIANFYSIENKNEEKRFSSAVGKSLLLVGSLSEMTTKQVEEYKKTGYPLVELEQINEHTVHDIFKKYKDEEILMVASSRTKGTLEPSLIEETLAELASLALNEGFTQLIIGGGETSGAVTKKLGFNLYHIGHSIAPGVPIMRPINQSNLQLVLKSGNFGQETFFIDALKMTGGLK